jgi:hypothetical protein
MPDFMLFCLMVFASRLGFNTWHGVKCLWLSCMASLLLLRSYSERGCYDV